MEKDEVMEKYNNLRDDKRTKAEIKKLKNLFKGLQHDKALLTEKLIENAAFMSVLLMDLQENIKDNGYKDKYQNGVNQYGYKKSVAADLYQTTIKNYTSVIKQLNDLLPNKDTNPSDNELLQFIIDHKNWLIWGNT